MEKKEFEETADRISSAAENLDASVQTVEEATESVHKAVKRVESNVAEGIQPDVRELRIWMSELDEKADIRLQRITWVMIVLIVLNIVSILLSILR